MKEPLREGDSRTYQSWRGKKGLLAMGAVAKTKDIWKTHVKTWSYMLIKNYNLKKIFVWQCPQWMNIAPSNSHWLSKYPCVRYCQPRKLQRPSKQQTIATVLNCSPPWWSDPIPGHHSLGLRTCTNQVEDELQVFSLWATLHEARRCSADCWGRRVTNSLTQLWTQELQ